MIFEDVLKIYLSRIILRDFHNELSTMEYIYLDKERNIFTRDWFKTLEERNDPINIKDSIKFREQGNKLLKDGKSYLLEACQLYTKAIYASPLNSDVLALAHANRALALQEFGYYSQAYDDCECALAGKYPEKLRIKLIVRQAYCSLKMGNVGKLKEHLSTLNEMELNENFRKNVEDLQNGLAKLLESEIADSLYDIEPDISQEKTEIVETNDIRGRILMTKNDIHKYEFIFSDRAYGFVPVNDRKVCQQCAAVHLIPFPCMKCSGEAIYCSLRCLKKHESIHKLECMGYKMQLFKQIGIIHLALRLVTKEVPKLIKLLDHLETAVDIWREINNPGNFVKDDTEFLNSLLLITHFDKMESNDVLFFGLGAQILLCYLETYTDFFKLFENTKAGRSEWELVTSALLMRRSGQMTINATCEMVPSLLFTDDPYNFTLLNDGFWESPYRFRRGCLHNLSRVDNIVAICFPYLSICNHSCEQIMQIKYSGTIAYTYANKELQIGNEITNCYAPDCRRARQSVRYEELSKIYKFQCSCVKCTASDPNVDYNKCIQQRCQNRKCGKIFIPKFNAPDIISAHENVEKIICTECKVPQPRSFYENIINKLEDLTDEDGRSEIFKSFEKLEKVYLGTNDLKGMLAILIVDNCLKAHFDGYFLSPFEFQKLEVIVKENLRLIGELYGVNSIHYATSITYLLDLIALKQCEVSQNEVKKMLIYALQTFPDDSKQIYLNYYKDYIMPIFENTE